MVRLLRFTVEVGLLRLKEEILPQERIVLLHEFEVVIEFVHLEKVLGAPYLLLPKHDLL